MLPPPEKLGRLLEDDLVVADVGARGGAADRWRSFGPRVKVVGFDPDEDECLRLAAAEPDVTYVPVALGPENRQAILYRTAEPACSSLYPPIVDLADQRPELHVIRPVGEEIVDLVSLDSWLEASPFAAVHFSSSTPRARNSVCWKVQNGRLPWSA